MKKWLNNNPQQLVNICLAVNLVKILSHDAFLIGNRGDKNYFMTWEMTGNNLYLEVMLLHLN